MKKLYVQPNLNIINVEVQNHLLEGSNLTEQGQTGFRTTSSSSGNLSRESDWEE